MYNDSEIFTEEKTNSAGNAFGYEYIPPVTLQKPKKKGGIVKKIALITASAVLFGVVAGSVMVGMEYGAAKLFGEKTRNEQEDTKTGVTATTVSNITPIVTGDEAIIASSTGIDVQAVVKSAMPAMVEITGTATVSGSSIYGQSYEAKASGTGIIVGQNENELLVLTNAHVVKDVNNLKCTFIDGSSANCVVKGSKSEKDIAVVAVALNEISADTAKAIGKAELADSTAVELGQSVVVIGNALGAGQSVTSGVISGKDRSITISGTTYTGLFMTDAAINSGNSGGAMLNAEGKVIGINFAAGSGVENIGYSIPVSNVKELIDTLMNKQTRQKVSEDKRAYFGIAAVDITSSVASTYGYPVGILVRTVADGSAASKAGIEVNDIIVGFDDQTVSTMNGFSNLLQYYSAGEKVIIDYYHLEGREYVLKSVEVTLGKRDA